MCRTCCSTTAVGWFQTAAGLLRRYLSVDRSIYLSHNCTWNIDNFSIACTWHQSGCVVYKYNFNVLPSVPERTSNTSPARNRKCQSSQACIATLLSWCPRPPPYTSPPGAAKAGAGAGAGELEASRNEAGFLNRRRTRKTAAAARTLDGRWRPPRQRSRQRRWQWQWQWQWSRCRHRPDPQRRLRYPRRNWRRGNRKASP